MRQICSRPISLRQVTIGGPKPLVCLPLVAKTTAELLEQAQTVMRFAPDLVEWRIDGFTAITDQAACLAALAGLRRQLGDTPLIFTCRIDQEGGMCSLDPAYRQQLILAALASGHCDLIDIELCSGPELIAAVRQAMPAGQVALILSYHNFQQTPAEDIILGKLTEADAAGADIGKVAVMPQSYDDVLTLLRATNRARQLLSVPLITMAMGEAGAVTRVVGGLFGSDVTFAVGAAASAPGQIPIADLRAAMAVLFPAATTVAGC